MRALSPNYWTDRELLQFLFNGAQQNFKNVFYISLKLFTHVFYFSSCARSFLRTDIVLHSSNLQQGSVQLLSRVQLFATPWTTEHQASMSVTNSWSLLKLMSIELVMPSNHFILCCPLLLLPSIFPASGSFPMSQFFALGGHSIGVSASVLPMSIHG